MKKIWAVFLLFIIIVFLYFFLSAVKINKKEIYRISNYFELNENNLKPADVNGYYFDEKECGFFNTDSGLIHYQKMNTGENVIATEKFYAVYNKVGSQIKVFNSFGNLISTIEDFGYPYLIEDYPAVFVVMTNGKGLSLYTIEGKKIVSSLRFTSIITDISADKFLNVLVSTLDGKSFLYSSDGVLINIFETKDSRINIAKSNYLSFQGDYKVICSGIEPEKINIYNHENKMILNKITGTNFKYNTLLSLKNNILYYEGENKINYYNLKNKKSGSFNVQGLPYNMLVNTDGTVLISSNLDDTFYISLFSMNGEKIFCKEFMDKIDNFGFIDNTSFYFKFMRYIIKFTIGQTA